MAKKEGSSKAKSKKSKQAEGVKKGKTPSSTSQLDLSGAFASIDDPENIQWDAVLTYWDEENVQKRSEAAQERLKEEEEELVKEQKKKEEILDKFYGIKTRGKPRPGFEKDAEIKVFSEEYGGETLEDKWENVPVDKEGWTEKDIGEVWADPPKGAKLPFYDPYIGADAAEDEDEEEEDYTKRSRRKKAPKKKGSSGSSRTSSNMYVPYRQGFPPLLEGEEVELSPVQTLEQMDQEEEFLDWASYVFADGSTYEGTVWNDLAQGRGVYVTPQELCRYEGEWVQNAMQGHGVLSVDIPVRVPPPDSAAWLKLKAEGKLFTEAHLSDFDKEWLKQELKDFDEQKKKQSVAGGGQEEEWEAGVDLTEKVPFEDDPSWTKTFGRKPEKGHYEYAGEFKQNKFHGCGVFSVNGKMHYGKFYFGEFLMDNEECDAHTSGLHAALAKVTAAKSRMFANKPDGMVREIRGPYSDPSHPYLYDDEDMWMAPGFINEFHPVPSTWSKYVEEVDKEQQMWLNSFRKAPLRLPTPSELSYQWEKDDEFVLLCKPNPGASASSPPSSPSCVLLHVPTKRIINWIKDDDGRVRFFVQPLLEGGKVDASKAKPLPLGFKEFLGEAEGEEEITGGEEREEEYSGKDPVLLKRARERRLKREEERENKRKERKDKALREKWREEDEALETEWEMRDKANESLEDYRREEWEKEGELLEDEFEARLAIMEGVGLEALVNEEGEKGEGSQGGGAPPTILATQEDKKGEDTTNEEERKGAVTQTIETAKSTGVKVAPPPSAPSGKKKKPPPRSFGSAASLSLVVSQISWPSVIDRFLSHTSQSQSSETSLLKAASSPSQPAVLSARFTSYTSPSLYPWGSFLCKSVYDKRGLIFEANKSKLGNTIAARRSPILPSASSAAFVAAKIERVEGLGALVFV